MTVKAIMTDQLITVEMDDSLAFAKALFAQHGFHHLLVLEHGCLVGIVSDRDLYKAISPNVGLAAANSRDEATLHKRIHQIMTRRPITVSPDDSIYGAMDLLLSNNISCLPVIDKFLQPRGIVSWRDILKALSKLHRQKKSR